jgi:ethanolamine transporter EutH
VKAARGAAALVVSTLVGVLAGSLVASLIFALVNLRTEDGPYFAPALVAAVIAVPIAVLLLPFQLTVVGWHRRAGPVSLRRGLATGALGGVVAGLMLALVLFESEQQTASEVLLFVLIGLVQGCATLGGLVYVTQRVLGGNR